MCLLPYHCITPSPNHLITSSPDSLRIQGSAADVVMLGMLRLWRSPVLKRLGWKLLLQIHDEVILEGPKQSRDEVRWHSSTDGWNYWLVDGSIHVRPQAMAEVRDCMENPFVGSCMSELLGQGYCRNRTA
jgi:hypothetical protein